MRKQYRIMIWIIMAGLLFAGTATHAVTITDACAPASCCCPNVTDMAHSTCNPDPHCCHAEPARDQQGSEPIALLSLRQPYPAETAANLPAETLSDRPGQSPQQLNARNPIPSSNIPIYIRILKLLC